MGITEREDIHKVIEDGISASMKPIYWTIGIANTVILLLISGLVMPLYSDYSDIKTDLSKKINQSEVYSNFLTKYQFNYLQGEEQKADVKAITNPTSCHDIYDELNRNRADQLEIRFRADR